jgi:hypothetical protein
VSFIGGYAMPPDAHDPVCRWSKIARPVLAVVPAITHGAAALGWPAGPSGAAVWMRRSCRPAREGQHFDWQSPKEWWGNRRDSQTLILGREAAVLARKNP